MLSRAVSWRTQLAIVLAMSLVASSAAIAQSIRLTSPTGGETWQSGTQRQITWTSSNLPSTGSLGLYYTVNGNGVLIASLPTTSGSYLWTLPTNSLNTTVWIGYYRADGSGTQISSESGPISITSGVATPSQMAIRLLSPTGGEQFEPGSVHEIRWSMTNAPATGTLGLYYTNNGTGQLIANLATTATSYRWTVPSGPRTTTIWIGYYLSTGGTTNISAESGPITIAAQSTPTNPSGDVAQRARDFIREFNQNYHGNRQGIVRWTKSPISVWADPGFRRQDITDAIGFWESLTAGRVRFSIASTQSAADVVLDFVPSLAPYNAPSGSCGVEGPTKGSGFEFVSGVGHYLNSGNCAPSGDWRIGVAHGLGHILGLGGHTESGSDLMGSPSSNFSPSAFLSEAINFLYSRPAGTPVDGPTRNEPSLRLTSPEGGEEWRAGSSHDIAWVASNLPPGGQLSLYYNSGGRQYAITTPAAGSLSYRWTVPNAPMNATVWIGYSLNGAWIVTDESRSFSVSGQSSASCSDARETIIEEYRQFKLTWIPTCNDFKNSGRSPHFTWAELNQQPGSGHPPWGIVQDIVWEGLERIREEYGRGALVVNSGYRCPHGNRDPSVGGADNSQHQYGVAADLRVANEAEYWAMRQAAQRVADRMGREIWFETFNPKVPHLHVDWRQ